MKKILIAVDGSTASEAALRSGLEIAGAEEAMVVLVHVVPASEVVSVTMFGAARGPHRPSTREAERLEAARAIAEEHGIHVTTRLLAGNPPDEIVAYADVIGADLIVVGSRGLGAIGRMVLGSVSGGVLRESRRPVLVVREVEARAPASVR